MCIKIGCRINVTTSCHNHATHKNVWHMRNEISSKIRLKENNENFWIVKISSEKNCQGKKWENFAAELGFQIEWVMPNIMIKSMVGYLCKNKIIWIVNCLQQNLK